jgi:predicted nucleic acid-binding protein
VNGFVLDSGALIALERRTAFLLDILDEVLRGAVQLVIPRTVIAQVWRGTPRQANVSRLIGAAGRADSPVLIDELTAERAKEIGMAVGRTSHPDIVDIHVALAAAERGHAVLTSDDADITHVDADLVIVHV